MWYTAQACRPNGPTRSVRSIQWGRVGWLVVAVWLLGLSLGTAQAGPHFTRPVPTLDQAVATANQQGKVLLVIFSASWCGPCKVLARDLRKPAAQPATEKLHIVVYDGSEDEQGSALMRKLGASGFPTLIAFDRAGLPAVRSSGYGSWNQMAKWFKELPERAVSIDVAMASADKTPKQGEVQLAMATRLLAARRSAEARRFLERAVAAGPDSTAVAAAWELLRLDYADGQGAVGRKLLEPLITRFPLSSEARRGLRFLAAMSQPPVPFLEAMLARRIDAAKSESDVTSLVDIALRGGAKTAAGRAAEWLARKYPETVGSLDAQAEIAFLVQHDVERACALVQKAMQVSQAKDGGSQDERTETLARYRRDQGEASEEVREFAQPRLFPDGGRSSGPSAFMGRLRQAQAAVRDKCAETGGAQSRLQAYVLTGKVAPHQVIFHPNTPAALANCAEPLLAQLDLPQGRSLSVEIELEAGADTDALELAVAMAEEECAVLADKERSLEVLLRAAPGGVPQIFHAGGKGSKELRACVEEKLGPLRVRRAILQTVSLRFPLPDK